MLSVLNKRLRRRVIVCVCIRVVLRVYVFDNG
jgi:hypothetical protein